MSSAVEFNESWMGSETPPDPEPSLAELLEDAIWACGGTPDPRIIRLVADRVEHDITTAACRRAADMLTESVDRLPPKMAAAWRVAFHGATTRAEAKAAKVSHVTVHKDAKQLREALQTPEVNSTPHR